VVTVSGLKRLGQTSLALRFSKDQRGVASIEFLMIVPLLLMLMFGAVQFTAGFAALRKLTVVSRTMSDLISQAAKVCTADIDNARAVGKAIMSPYPTTNMSTTILQVLIDSGNAKVVWSRGDKDHSVGSFVTVPKDIAVDGRYLIMSEVEYDFTPAVGFRMSDKFNSEIFHFSRTSFTTPRQGNSVDYDPNAPCG
jgi:Flp pilus assembly protein TadG